MKIKTFRGQKIITGRTWGFATWIHTKDGKIQDKRYRNIHEIDIDTDEVKFKSYLHKKTAKRKLDKIKMIEYVKESVKKPFITKDKDAYKKKNKKKSIWSWTRNI